MAGRRGLALVGAAIIVAAVVVLVIVKPGSSSKIHDTGLVHVAVVGGKPQGGVKSIKVSKGGNVHLLVSSDVADEVHIHGFNLHKDVPKNGTARFDFVASMSGGFVIELEHRSEQIAALDVSP